MVEPCPPAHGGNAIGGRHGCDGVDRRHGRNGIDACCVGRGRSDGHAGRGGLVGETHGLVDIGGHLGCTGIGGQDGLVAGHQVDRDDGVVGDDGVVAGAGSRPGRDDDWLHRSLVNFGLPPWNAKKRRAMTLPEQRERNKSLGLADPIIPVLAADRLQAKSEANVVDAGINRSQAAEVAEAATRNDGLVNVPVQIANWHIGVGACLSHDSLELFGAMPRQLRSAVALKMTSSKLPCLNVKNHAGDNRSISPARCLHAIILEARSLSPFVQLQCMSEKYSKKAAQMLIMTLLAAEEVTYAYIGVSPYLESRCNGRWGEDGTTWVPGP